MSKLTPLMKQYFQIKNVYPDTLLFFQIGDFYELFYEDAKNASKFLGITLTQRGKDANGDPIPLAGVPVHVLNHYIVKLVKGGYKVAICDQLSEPRPGTVVERGVTQVFTPGTLTDSNLLDDKSSSYLSVFYNTYNGSVLLFAEILTGKLYATFINGNINTKDENIIKLESELSKFIPDEILVSDNNFASRFKRLGYTVTQEKIDDSAYMQNELNSWISEYIAINDKIKQILDKSDTLKSALYLLYAYLKRNNKTTLKWFKSLSIYKSEDYLMLDANTIKNLELIKNNKDNTIAHTLFSVLDKSCTPMGSRFIKQWILRPLINQERINQRLNVIEYFLKNFTDKQILEKELKKIGDLERIVGRIALNRATIYDYKNLESILNVTFNIKDTLSSIIKEDDSLESNRDKILLKKIYSYIDDFSELQKLLNNSLNDESNDWVIKSNFNEELDYFRNLVTKGAEAILSLENQEQQATKINSLKIRYNKVHGYGIEITKANLHLVPDNYMRVQTLANRERFTIQALKDLEYDLVRAQKQIIEIEQSVFQSVKDYVYNFLNKLKRLSFSISQLSALLSLSQIAYLNNYVRPEFNDNQDIIIKSGKHPVLDDRLKSKFIPNDTNLTEKQSLWLITGPNMGGKSTYLRQNALILIMAQIGSFVPAKSANIPIVDRIFTRIGASDALSEDKSTFLVEMQETALICNQATSKSLVILDEVGRGTSTFDGLAIAQAVVEYIYTNIKARCLFATHYHELTDLSNNLKNIGCYYTASVKQDDGIVLLHKIVQGVANGSFGVEVAKFAQLPELIINRSYEILNKIAKDSPSYNTSFYSIGSDINFKNINKQDVTSIKDNYSYIAAELTDLDYDNITPKQALDILFKFKNYINNINID